MVDNCGVSMAIVQSYVISQSVYGAGWAIFVYFGWIFGMCLLLDDVTFLFLSVASFFRLSHSVNYNLFWSLLLYIFRDCSSKTAKTQAHKLAFKRPKENGGRREFNSLQIFSANFTQKL